MTGIYINGFSPSVDLLRVVNQFKRVLDYKTPSWYFAFFITKEKTWFLRREIYRVKILMINSHDSFVIESKSKNVLTAVFQMQRQVWQKCQESRDGKFRGSNFPHQKIDKNANLGNSVLRGQH